MTDLELTDDLLNEYLDGELSETDHQAVAAAIAQSPAAQARLAALEALFATFNDVQDVPLSTDLTPGVLTAVATRPALTTPHWLRLLPLLQVAAAVVLVILFWGTLQSWWQYGRALLPTTLPPVTLPDLGELINGWRTAVAGIAIPSLQLDLAFYQWAILIGLALVVWLLGARLLFTDPTSPSGRHV